MLTRIITAVVALCIFVPVCIFSETVLWEIAMSVLCVTAIYEIWHCFRGDDKSDEKRYIGSFWLYIPALFVAVFHIWLPQLSTLLKADMTMPESSSIAMELLASVFFFVMMYVFAVVVFSRGKISIANAGVMLMMTFYVTISFVSLVCLRRHPSGEALYLLPFIGAWVSDTFAYFTGRLFGKHKLIPEVSPKKTVEGAVGGVVFTAIAYVIFGLIVRQGNLHLNYILLAVIGALVSVLSQIGDLIASVVKRHYGIKDYGKLFPGHGGVMDRFDSVIATAPVLYFFYIAFLNILF
ncbi:MAG: phosphatidate cytidylyltransferase [Clostridia bacterium]|nr:phosphatidate cytidylyltransferase [Clostridia bacterium]